jgi:hypothetical protein
LNHTIYSSYFFFASFPSYHKNFQKARIYFAKQRNGMPQRTYRFLV